MPDETNQTKTPSEPTKAVFTKISEECATGSRLCPQKFGAAVRAMMQTMREAEFAATELAYMLGDVSDHAERQTAVRDMENRVQGLKDRIGKAREWTSRAESTVREIEREYPKIAKKLGVQVEGPGSA